MKGAGISFHCEISFEIKSSGIKYSGIKNTDIKKARAGQGRAFYPRLIQDSSTAA
jgi:hypothetical protein